MWDSSLAWVPSFSALAFPQKALPKLGLSKKAKSPSLNYSTLDLHLSVHPSVHTTDANGAPKGLAKVWEAAVPPLGSFNPPPTEGVRSVLDANHIAYT